ncbi:hypothetical protein D3C83_148940 [compost metagenome]
MGPARISNSPGSTTSFMSMSHIRNASGPSVKRTVLRSPGCNDTRSNAFSSLIGRVTEATWSWT